MKIRHLFLIVLGFAIVELATSQTDLELSQRPQFPCPFEVLPYSGNSLQNHSFP